MLLACTHWKVLLFWKPLAFSVLNFKSNKFPLHQVYHKSIIICHLHLNVVSLYNYIHINSTKKEKNKE